ncbi:anthranilate synthase, component I [Ectothiorhodosinus mongolicus]|uniref:Anthranilate synthase component 1 n=1 Tax=Ectothiorhodosinus mongolicus TaxID=233100 RepID=A0A1R3VX07_9GAMM|nr:anthranilate synthase component I [Ectothiorhodosinus mongolicus]ULX56916.1 anthranilate synthase component I [Ectothiorhodosinus mongolicus]SIT68970.1 anthranilate synthase, component I [Ectothiorhodosinus mongolicus]
MTPDIFDSLVAKGYNRIPLVREVLADLDTPLSVFMKLAAKPYSYLFESVQGGEKWGRYSFIGLPARTVVRVQGRLVEVREDGEVIEAVELDDPLEWIESYQARFRVPDLPNLPRFTGGLVGYFGYETIAYIEPRLADAEKSDPLQVPDILLMVSDEVIAYDNLAGRLYIVVHASPGGREQAEARLDAIEQELAHASHWPEPLASQLSISESDFVSGFTEEGFKQAVQRCKEYIVEGDVMQVVLSQRLSIPFQARPLDLYRALRGMNPSPYMFYLDLGDHQVVGASPEILVRLEDDEVTVRPIAGTRPRGRSVERDEALERELLADPKELAEHLMLIDLGRNDVGRVAEIGSVRLTDQMMVERYSHVMHIVSNVVGRLRRGLKAMDVLRATFPAGTVSGAPKIRAMEIINELEPVKRGIYSGAVGYLSWQGNMDTAIAIRTAVIKDQVLHIQAGAGIVHDSTPENEWAETMNKGRAIFRAVSMAEAGLRLQERSESSET